MRQRCERHCPPAAFGNSICISVFYCLALTMIGQTLDNPTLGDLPSSALRDHPLKLALQGGQACYPLLDLFKTSTCDRIGGCA